MMEHEPIHEPVDESSPEAMLDRLRANPGWDDRRREAYLGRLVERFPSDRIKAAILPRLDDLTGADAESILRLIEANPEAVLIEALAAAVDRQADLPPERVWEALAILEGAAALEGRPTLVERWNDLLELFEEEDSIGQLVEQLDDDPDGVWLALQGLDQIEAEVRPEIIGGLAGTPLSAGLLEFLRLLAYTTDVATRSAAWGLLEDAGADTPGLADAWADLAANHPEPACRERAAARARPSGSRSITVAAGGCSTRPAVDGLRVVRSLVTAVDGQGRGWVVLVSERVGKAVMAAFHCDVAEGLVEVVGEVGDDAAETLAAFDSLDLRIDRDFVQSRHDLALALLAGSLWLGGDKAPPSARYWVEATAGGSLRPQPLRGDVPGWDPLAVPYHEMPARSLEVLEACPSWRDESPLTDELAEELLLRDGGGPPDPGRDSGAYRFLFERRLKGQLELYRRMLLWMTWFWKADGRDRLATSAQALAWQLSDAQHIVPGHPFTVGLTTRSLAAAQERRASGRPGVLGGG